MYPEGYLNGSKRGPPKVPFGSQKWYFPDFPFRGSVGGRPVRKSSWMEGAISRKDPKGEMGKKSERWPSAWHGRNMATNMERWRWTGQNPGFGDHFLRLSGCFLAVSGQGASSIFLPTKGFPRFFCWAHFRFYKWLASITRRRNKERPGVPATGVRNLKGAQSGRRGCKRCFDQLERWSPESVLHQCDPLLHQCNRLLVHMHQNTFAPSPNTLGTFEVSDTCSRHSGSQNNEDFVSTDGAQALTRLGCCISTWASWMLYWIDARERESKRARDERARERESERARERESERARDRERERERETKNKKQLSFFSSTLAMPSASHRGAQWGNVWKCSEN